MSIFAAIHLVILINVILVHCYDEQQLSLRRRYATDDHHLYSSLRNFGFRKNAHRGWIRRSKSLPKSMISREPPLCEEPFISFQDGCYYMTEERMPFYAAKRFCKEMDAFLPTVKNTAQNRFIKYLSGGLPVWIGLKKKKRKWFWLDKSRARYRAWSRREPDGCCGPNVRCVQMNPRKGSGRWADVSCERKNAVICKYDIEGRILKTEQEGVVRKPMCGTGYKLFKNFCYKVGVAEIAPASRNDEESSETEETPLINSDLRRRRYRRYRRHAKKNLTDNAEHRNQTLFLPLKKDSTSPMFSEDNEDEEKEMPEEITPTIKKTNTSRKKPQHRFKNYTSLASTLQEDATLSSVENLDDQLCSKKGANQNRLFYEKVGFSYHKSHLHKKRHLKPKVQSSNSLEETEILMNSQKSQQKPNRQLAPQPTIPNEVLQLHEKISTSRLSDSAGESIVENSDKINVNGKQLPGRKKQGKIQEKEKKVKKNHEEKISVENVLSYKLNHKEFLGKNYFKEKSTKSQNKSIRVAETKDVEKNDQDFIQTTAQNSSLSPSESLPLAAFLLPSPKSLTTLPSHSDKNFHSSKSSLHHSHIPSSSTHYSRQNTLSSLLSSKLPSLYHSQGNKLRRKRHRRKKPMLSYPNSHSLPPIQLDLWSRRMRQARLLKKMPYRYSSFDPEVLLPPPIQSPFSSHQRLRTGITMEEAEKKCKADGAELASICSDEENNFIKGLIKAKNFGSAWFGLHVIPEFLEYGTWYREFTDKQSCSYRNWMFGKPDNQRTKRNSMCTIISPDGDWDDFDCDDTKYIRMYVCKKPSKMMRLNFDEP